MTNELRGRNGITGTVHVARALPPIPDKWAADGSGVYVPLVQVCGFRGGRNGQRLYLDRTEDAVTCRRCGGNTP